MLSVHSKKGRVRESMCGSIRVVGGPDPMKNHKAIGSLSNTGPDPLKNQKATSIHCWAIIGLSAKRHLNGFSLAGR